MPGQVAVSHGIQGLGRLLDRNKTQVYGEGSRCGVYDSAKKYGRETGQAERDYGDPQQDRAERAKGYQSDRPVLGREHFRVLCGGPGFLGSDVAHRRWFPFPVSWRGVLRCSIGGAGRGLSAAGV